MTSTFNVVQIFGWASESGKNKNKWIDKYKFCRSFCQFCLLVNKIRDIFLAWFWFHSLIFYPKSVVKHISSMECLLGLRFDKFVLLAADTTEAVSIVVNKKGKKSKI